MDFDILIRNATVFDGTGAEGYRGDVGIKGGVIAAIGDLRDATATDEIDATGMAVCPGFIDAHTHVHVNIDRDIMHEDNLVRQGITTVVGGNCGKSGWPIGEHLDKVDRLGMKQNYLVLAGHHTIRRDIFGDDQARFLDPPDFKLMQAHVERAMDEGAFGVTVGYATRWESNDEIFAFAEPAGKRDGIYASHIRSESRHLLEAIGEILEVAQHADIRIQISHLKTDSPANWDKLDTVFCMLEEACDRGLGVRADRYTYVGWHGGSTNALPRVAYQIRQERGSWESLRDPDVAQMVMEELEKMHAENGGPDRLLFCSMREPRPEIEGKTPAQLAAEWQVDLLEVGIRLEKMGGVSAIGLTMSEDNLQRILAHPLVGIGSDSSQEADKGVQTHPRSYGTFPRVLAGYVREEGVLTLPEAIYKMSGQHAEHFGITDRGLLGEGLVADVVVFDPWTVQDKAEFLNAHQYPEGIPYVIVNGKFAVKAGRTTPENHGRALRKTDM
ncbi:MAG: amidohydrolase family protein [candidate division WS1 bacterium]|jgi:N-acyl-D-aspartate/D-glutamate deacylase|nr:amidohydrolase family protein [candidate division WS1 bacterium]